MSTARRFLDNAELRVADDGEMRIEGVAIRYNALSKANVPAAGCREKIAPGCFTRSLKSDGDVLAYYNHDSNALLARTSNGSLRLMDGKDALRFSIRLNPNVSLHRDIHALTKDRTLRGMSFGFVADDDDWQNGTDDDGKRCQIRTVKTGRLAEISIVGTPAYPNTDAQARALVEHELEEQYADLVERYQKIKIF